MKRPELTYEEFCLITMTYCTGMTFDTGAQRLYRNEQYGIQKETYTPRNPKTGKWGTGKSYFFLDGDERTFETSDQCYVAYMEKACGVTA